MTLRQKDMSYSFFKTIEKAITHKIDAVLLCGDLFHHKNVTAQTLAIAEDGLKRFSDQKIPVLFNQGNHDAKLYKQDMTWLE